MILTVLGGAAAGGNTGAGCSGYLLQSDDTNLVIDLGPGTLLELRKHCDFRTLDAIVISHWHVDHYLDLAALRFAGAYNPQPLVGQIPLYMPPGGEYALRRFGASLPLDEPDLHFFDECFSIREFDPMGRLMAGSFTIRFQPTKHFVPCWALRVADRSGAELGYTADTGPDPALESFFASVDLLVAESTELDRDPAVEQAGHLTAAEAGYLATTCGSRRLLLTHMWEEHDFQDHLLRARETYAGDIMLARPGLQVEITGPE